MNKSRLESASNFWNSLNQQKVTQEKLFLEKLRLFYKVIKEDQEKTELIENLIDNNPSIEKINELINQTELKEELKELSCQLPNANFSEI